MGEQSAVAQRAAFARRAARTLAAHVAVPLPAVQDAERQLAVAHAAVRQPAARISALKLAERARHVAQARRAGPEPGAPPVPPGARKRQGHRARATLLLLLLRASVPPRLSPLRRKR
jgi:hypothetical protein